MLDPDLPIPMVAPADLGVTVADLLTRSVPATGIHFVEDSSAARRPMSRRTSGPRSAAASTSRSPRERAGCLPSARWGSPPEAAESYAGLTAVVVDGDIERPEWPTRGTTTLQEYVEALVTGS